MTARGKIYLLILISLVLIIQLVPVETDNPEVTADFDGDARIGQLLRRCCYDCHSHETCWPWYSHLAPVSWLIARDVHEGREHLNFSEWAALPDQKRRLAREEIWEEIEDDEMPPSIYLFLHGDAALSDSEKTMIHDWSTQTPNTVDTALIDKVIGQQTEDE